MFLCQDREQITHYAAMLKMTEPRGQAKWDRRNPIKSDEDGLVHFSCCTNNSKARVRTEKHNKCSQM